jgi:hypothetical protein
MTPQHSYPPDSAFGKALSFHCWSHYVPCGYSKHRSQIFTKSCSLFFNQRIVPSLIRLVGDLFGKEAERETNIGDTKHVNKHINQYGRLTGWFVPRTK